MYSGFEHQRRIAVSQVMKTDPFTRGLLGIYQVFTFRLPNYLLLFAMLQYRETAGICARQQRSREDNMYIRKISGILFSSLILAALLSGMLVFQSPQPVQAASKANVSGVIWEDTNQNGIQDADEDGIRGVKVKVYKADGKYVKSATTKSSGLYELKNISPGAYYL